MNFKYLLIIFCSFVCTVGYGQKKIYQERGLSVNLGLHLAYSSIIFRDEQNFENTIPSWQVWFNKEFFQENSVALILAIGASNDLFNVIRKIEDSNGNFVYQRRRVQILNGNIEGGVRFAFLSESKLPMLTSLCLRVSTPLKENYSEIYLMDPGSSDVGLNFKIGPKFNYGPTRLYVLLNLHQGLSKLARNKVRTSSGPQDSYIQNRSLGIQLGIFL